MKNLIRILFLIAAFIISFAVYAESKEFFVPNQIAFEVQGEKWVVTKTAEVTISADAILDKTSSAAMREEIIKKLAAIGSNISWNTTVFNISQNDSGLDQLHVEAQARLGEDLLAGLNAKIKDMTRPGLTFRVVNISFSPSLSEVEAAKAELRSRLYQEALSEVSRINSIYKDKKYSVHAITINSLENPPIYPIAMASFASALAPRIDGAGMNKMKVNSVPMVSVSTKIQMSANVILASE